MGVGEVCKHSGRIVTYRGQPEPALRERGCGMLQLDELRLAIWSPVGAAGENQQDAL
jgi:hypothetical protein